MLITTGRKDALVAKALRNYVSTPIPQTEKASPLQRKNNAGGYSFVVSDYDRLLRFLVLGVDGGTYYVGERDITKQNVDFLRRMIKEDPSTVINTVLDVSINGRAYRNSAAIFTLALVLSESDSAAVKQAARNVVPHVARTATMVYELADYISKLGGWGPAKVKAIRGWFDSKTPDQLAYQAVKYRQRNGWTMRDLMRLSHPKGIDVNVGNFILGKEFVVQDSPAILGAYENMRLADSVTKVVNLLERFPFLPWETIPTQFLKEPKVWKKLFDNGLSGQALVRNITRFAKMNLLSDLVFAREMASRLTDENMIKKTKLHPMQFLNAYVVYTQGQRERKELWRASRSKTWSTSGVVKDALDDGFGLAFGNIEPSNKRTMVSVDVSGSMSWAFAGDTDFTAAQASGAMSLIIARTEPYYVVNGFTGSLTQLNFSAKTSIEEAFAIVQRHNFGSTDVSLPMVFAKQNGLDIDTFVVITDNETWAGRVHPHKALDDYRKASGLDSRLVVMGMTSTDFTIANPLDKGMMDVVGFDTNTPKVVSDFSAGRI